MNDDLKAAWQAVLDAKTRLREAIQSAEPEPVEDHTLRTPDGDEVRLSELFGGKRDLIVAHNMGKGCVYCTLWADGFRGYTEHLEDRAGFVLCSHDEPETLRAFAAERGWNFRCVSGAGSGFTGAMGFLGPSGGPEPGVSAFHKLSDGSIVRTGSAPFGPGDDFCPVWPFFDLLKGGADGWEPRYTYG